MARGIEARFRSCAEFIEALSRWQQRDTNPSASAAHSAIHASSRGAAFHQPAAPSQPLDSGTALLSPPTHGSWATSQPEAQRLVRRSNAPLVASAVLALLLVGGGSIVVYILLSHGGSIAALPGASAVGPAAAPTPSGTVPVPGTVVVAPTLSLAGSGGPLPSPSPGRPELPAPAVPAAAAPAASVEQASKRAPAGARVAPDGKKSMSTGTPARSGSGAVDLGLGWLARNRVETAAISVEPTRRNP